MLKKSILVVFAICLLVGFASAQAGDNIPVFSDIQEEQQEYPEWAQSALERFDKDLQDMVGLQEYFAPGFVHNTDKHGLVLAASEICTHKYSGFPAEASHCGLLIIKPDGLTQIITVGSSQEGKSRREVAGLYFKILPFGNNKDKRYIISFEHAFQDRVRPGRGGLWYYDIKDVHVMGALDFSDHPK